MYIILENQFRVEGEKRRICEERIVTFEALGPRAALRKAKTKGRGAQSDYKAAGGNTVWFEFVGARDMVALETICGPDEVWYDIKRYLTPMERRDKLIPSDERILNHM